MRWLFRFSVYFLKPIIVTAVIGYFAFLSVKAVAYAVSCYMRAERRAERAELSKAHGADGKGTAADRKAGRTRRASEDRPVTGRAAQISTEGDIRL